MEMKWELEGIELKLGTQLLLLKKGTVQWDSWGF